MKSLVESLIESVNNENVEGLKKLIEQYFPKTLKGKFHDEQEINGCLRKDLGIRELNPSDFGEYGIGIFAKLAKVLKSKVKKFGYKVVTADPNSYHSYLFIVPEQTNFVKSRKNDYDIPAMPEVIFAVETFEGSFGNFSIWLRDELKDMDI